MRFVVAHSARHGLQVLEWTQTMLQIGEAFSGSESSSLRDAMQRQSGRFFQAFHAANLQVPCLCLCMPCPRTHPDNG